MFKTRYKVGSLLLWFHNKLQEWQVDECFNILLCNILMEVKGFHSLLIAFLGYYELDE